LDCNDVEHGIYFTHTRARARASKRDTSGISSVVLLTAHLQPPPFNPLTPTALADKRLRKDGPWGGGSRRTR